LPPVCPVITGKSVTWTRSTKDLETGVSVYASVLRRRTAESPLPRGQTTYRGDRDDCRPMKRGLPGAGFRTHRCSRSLRASG
jgi:hypothetical protein